MGDMITNLNGSPYGKLVTTKKLDSFLIKAFSNGNMVVADLPLSKSQGNHFNQDDAVNAFVAGWTKDFFKTFLGNLIAIFKDGKYRNVFVEGLRGGFGTVAQKFVDSNKFAKSTLTVQEVAQIFVENIPSGESVAKVALLKM